MHEKTTIQEIIAQKESEWVDEKLKEIEHLRTEINNIMTNEELFEKYVHFYHLEDNYVYLKEDDKGRYIEYAYKEGAPHDNRCLSWYEKPHPNYMKKHPKTVIKCKTPNTNTIYRLWEFSCGLENKEGDEKCTAGHPKKSCVMYIDDYWTYDEPVKCACWNLEECDFKFYVPEKDIEEFSKFILYDE